jgi:F-type H+-transporting ATPase subunit delta
MRGASRPSYAGLREQLAAATQGGQAQAETLGNELFAVTGLLDTEHGLRRALSDPGKRGAEKAAVARQLLHGKVSPATEELVGKAADNRWASSADLSDALEQLAIEAMVISAEYQRTSEELEDDLFRFGRLLTGQPELRAALADPVLPRENKQNLLSALLSGKVSPVALSLITQVTLHPRGRALPVALELCAQIAATRRQRLIAVVRTAGTLTAQQQQRLTQALANAYGHDVHLNVVIDPAVVGGLSIQIGDELIDGTAASRLAAVRRKLAA